MFPKSCVRICVATSGSRRIISESPEIISQFVPRPVISQSLEIMSWYFRNLLRSSVGNFAFVPLSILSQSLVIIYWATEFVLWSIFSHSLEIIFWATDFVPWAILSEMSLFLSWARLSTYGETLSVTQYLLIFNHLWSLIWCTILSIWKTIRRNNN